MTDPQATGEHSAEQILGPNPFVGFRKSDLAREAGRAAALAIGRPATTVAALGDFGENMARILRGSGAPEPHPKDRRFRDPAWRENAVYRFWLQSYLAAGESLDRWVEHHDDLDAQSRERLGFVAQLFKDAIAPSNFPIQPSALKKARETRGRSVLAGLRNLAADVRHNRGLPSQVDRTAFAVGENLATTPGSVIRVTPQMELIQYRPTCARVRRRPILMVPPQINKYYVFDLSPEKSIVKHLLDAGFQVYVLSWFNPGPEQAHWGLADYADAVDDAVSTVRAVSRADRVNLVGACAGGMTVASYAATRLAEGDTRFNSLTLLVSMIDQAQADNSPLGLFATPKVLRAIKAYSRRRGIFPGDEMAAAFSWMRPNDLIWNYWVNNVLLGQRPPAFDILYWNNDSTRLPATLHGEFIDMYSRNLLARGELDLDGRPVDLGDIQCDAYLVGGVTDHITPWRACYRNTQLLGGDSTFVLSNAGHIQALLNAPGKRKAEFWVGDETPDDADAWWQAAERHEGSWWPHWHDWLHARSGDFRRAPRTLGNKRFPALYPAPGKYVFG